MKSFACFSIIFLARFAISENSPSCAPQIKYCVLDDSLEVLRNQTTSGPQFCREYLEDDGISLPPYVPAAASTSGISSACSCLIEAQPTSKPAASTNSSYILGSAGSSVSATEILSHETTAVPDHLPVVMTGSPSFTPNHSPIGDRIHYLDYTRSKTVPVEYTTSAVHTLSTYTDVGGDVVTKTIVDYTTVYAVTGGWWLFAATGYSIPANSTTSYIPSGTGIRVPVYSTTSHVALGTGNPIPINFTTPSVFPTSNSSLEIVKSSSELPETIKTSTVAPASVTVFKRSTESDPYPFTSTYNMDQQSSACSCLSIQAAETSVTTTIIVPEQSKIVTSTAACTPIPTQAVVNGDFETATSGSSIKLRGPSVPQLTSNLLTIMRSHRTPAPNSLSFTAMSEVPEA
ncbi:hypothetical protein DID88_009863 [Monilinia fructigena]|uniref:Uncharacterized protein n=1 Tax=Monilinia fructigena TaxID=38457 RepID=A0A395IMH6_9HELO|nr:hypothetical protein DID88_009863 [Monilinia fructigena]